MPQRPSKNPPKIMSKYRTLGSGKIVPKFLVDPKISSRWREQVERMNKSEQARKEARRRADLERDRAEAERKRERRQADLARERAEVERKRVERQRKERENWLIKKNSNNS